MPHHTEIPAFPDEPWLRVGDRALHSRLVLGIEQYTSAPLVADVLRAAGADVFITTYDLDSTRSSLLLSDLDRHADLDDYVWIGTTSFARSTEDAVRTARALRTALGLDVIKLDVRDTTNLPDADATLVAAKELLADGFHVLPFVQPDPHVVTQLEELGCCAVRLMASPVASFRGLDDVAQLEQAMRALTVPVVVEGGIGSPADVVRAFEIGADAVLVNTAVARAADPVRAAAAMRHAALAGGLARSR